MSGEGILTGGGVGVGVLTGVGGGVGVGVLTGVGGGVGVGGLTGVGGGVGVGVLVDSSPGQYQCGSGSAREQAVRW